MSVYSVNTIANYFIQKSLDSQNPAENVTHLKLQKLVFIAQGFHLAYFDKLLFIEGIKAWTYGPVVPELFDRLRTYGRADVVDLINFQFADNSIDQIIDDGTVLSRSLLDEVWRVYGAVSGGQLVTLTHQKGSPWHQVYEIDKNDFGDIPIILIHNYYKAKI